MNKTFQEKYNQSDSLLVLSSYPKKDGEVAEENAVARYSHLLLQNFPVNQKIVVLCEKRNENEAPFEVAENILVVPTYTKNSPKFSFEVLSAVNKFPKVKDVLVQFEFSIFGGKVVLPGVLLTLSVLRLTKHNISFVFHQVIRDLAKLSGHLGIEKRSIRKSILNSSLFCFYKGVGAVANSIIVHDSLLKEQLKGAVNEEKVFVIPHGCGDTSYLSPELRTSFRKKWKIKDNDLIILAYGYLSWYKGTDWIIKTVGQLAKKYPERNIKLLLPGVQSPTLKGTKSFETYKKRLARLFKKYNKNLIRPGFIPESEVSAVFAAADVVVFPYRARMSASGALSIAWQYGKKVLVSSEFAKNYYEEDAKKVLDAYDVSPYQITFHLNANSFEESLFSLLGDPGAGYKVARASKAIAQIRSWPFVAQKYSQVCKGMYSHSEALTGEFSYGA